jgi:hypothetical protein
MVDFNFALGFAKFFCEIFYSRIDNTRLNFTLDTPGSASELKNS